MNMTEVFQCVYCSANAVSIRDGLDTETGTESLLSHRRERERERARRRARETEREYYQPGTDGSYKCNYPVISKLLHFSSSHSTPNCLTLHKSKKIWTDSRHVWKKKKGPQGSRGVRWSLNTCISEFSEGWRRKERGKKWISSQCVKVFLEFTVLPNNCPPSVSCVRLRFMVRGCFPLGSHTPVLYHDYTLSDYQRKVFCCYCRVLNATIYGWKRMRNS